LPPPPSARRPHPVNDGPVAAGEGAGAAEAGEATGAGRLRPSLALVRVLGAGSI
jgi:hypothetical protein